FFAFFMCFRFSVSRLQRPDSRDISHSGYAAEETPLRQIVLSPSNLHGRFRFSMSRLQRLAPRVIGQPSCAAKSTASLLCLMPVGAEQPLPLFLASARCEQLLLFG